MKTLRASALVLLGVLATTLTAFAGDPSGTWKFTVEGPKGRTAEATLTLAWADNRLAGIIDNRAGRTDISEATFANDEIAFTVVRKFGRLLRKKTFTTHYSGKLEGDKITGLISTTGPDEKPASVAWNATRAK